MSLRAFIGGSCTMDRISESHEAAGNPAGIPIEASLNYIESTSEKPVYYAYEPPAGTPRLTGKFVAHTVPIRNAREVVRDLSLDKQGFQLTHQETAVRDFYDAQGLVRRNPRRIRRRGVRSDGASQRVLEWRRLFRRCDAESPESRGNPCRATDVFGCVVIVDIRGQDAAQMALVEDNDVIQTLAADRTDHSLDVSVLPR